MMQFLPASVDVCHACLCFGRTLRGDACIHVQHVSRRVAHGFPQDELCLDAYGRPSRVLIDVGKFPIWGVTTPFRRQVMELRLVRSWSLQGHTCESLLIQRARESGFAWWLVSLACCSKFGRVRVELCYMRLLL